MRRKESMMVNQVGGGGYDVASMWQNLFKKIDTNGDDTLDKSELESIASNLGTSAADILTKLDSNQDGTIGKSEFEEALSKLREKHPPGPPPQANGGASPEDIFNQMDTDGDGTISKAELKSAMAQMVPGGLDVDKIFKEVDTDNDGVISRTESDVHMEKMKEKKEGPPPVSASSPASDGIGWESKMIEKLLSVYNVSANESTASKSSYA
jgi:Ca2+-binding EF-hand superfamily protein